MRFVICVVRPTGFVHSHAFDETADALVEALQALGHEAILSRRPTWPGHQCVVLGWNLLEHTRIELPPDAILYNLEQVQSDSVWFNEKRLAPLRRYRLWDYSPRNIQALRGLGIEGVKYLPIGYTPGLTRIRAAEVQDIDVLFYGSLNDRRRGVLQQLVLAGLKLHTVVGVFGPERDDLIARAKIVLNLHFYPAQVLEEVRVSYLLANRVCVISEDGDPEAEAPYRDGMVLVAAERILETCQHYLARPQARGQIAAQGFERVRDRPLTKYLADVLATSGA